MRMHPIAIVGLGSIFPGSTSVAGFWKQILEKRDLISEVPVTHWRIEDYYDPDPSAPDKTYCKRGAFLPEVPFDYMKYGIPPSNLSSTDTSQLLGLMVAEAALDDATRGRFPDVDRERISVILGNTGASELFADMAARTRRPRWEEALRHHGLSAVEVERISREIAELTVPWTEASFPGLLGNVVAGRIAHRLDLHGTNCVVDAACASSLAALSMGVAELLLDAADMVLVGGIDTMNDPMMFMCFSETPALSPSGDCRPFSDEADGTLLGEGLAIVALRRLEDAERDGNPIYAVLRGIGTSSDGKSKSVYAPVHEGQARALRRAYASAGYASNTVELVEAHGTATKAGDLTEFVALREVFGESDAAGRQWCALGSIKSQIGHTKCTAGVAGLLKSVLALHHKTLPPTLKVNKPNENLGIDQSPFYLNTETRPWIRSPRHPRRASVSSFGFGGSNFHVTLEEYCGPARPPGRFRQAPAELLVWSCEDPAHLQATAGRTLASVQARSNADPDLVRRAHDSQEAFDGSLPARLAIVARDLDDLEHKLSRALESLSAAPTEPISARDGVYYEHAADAGPIAFVFAGQGSQYVNMGRDLALMFDAARQVWDHAADMDVGEIPLHAVVFPRPAFSKTEHQQAERRIKQPQWSQPAIAACALSQLAVLGRLGIPVHATAGHSFGELVALHAAGVFDARTLFELARKRGQAMAAATTEETSMTAVFASAQKVAEILGQTDDVVIANLNSPSQTVVSGSVRSLAAIERALQEAKVDWQRLPVGAAFHSPFMRPAASTFGDYVRTLDLRTPQRPVFACSSTETYGEDDRMIAQSLTEQLHQPVRFAETIRAMHAEGYRMFIEVGPGCVLTPLIEEILSGEAGRCISIDRRGAHGVTQLWHALARLAVLGVPLEFASLWEEFREVPIEATAAPNEHSIMISGANYGRPYPPRAAATVPRTSRSESEPHAGDDSLKAAMSDAAFDGGNVHASEGVSITPTRLENPGQGFPTSTLGPEGSTDTRWPAREAPDNTHRPTNRRGSAAAPATANDAPMRNGGPPGESAPASGSSSGAAPDDAWLHTLQQLERSTTEAEKAFQKALKESYHAYLEAMHCAQDELEKMQRGLEASASERSTPAPTDGAGLDVRRVVEPLPEPVWQSLEDAPPEPTPPSPPEPTPPRSRAAARNDLAETLLGIVAEKTGYPKDLLDLDLELEAGLGIDSIKRVEIFSALQNAAPDTTSRPDPSELLKLATLRDVLDFLESSQGESTTGRQSADAPRGSAAPASPGPAPEDRNDALVEILLGIVAEKTGYPKDLLDLDLELEAGLGIDSIKRVEIFSALQNAAPDTTSRPDPSELLKLATLRDVLQAVGGLNGGRTNGAASISVRESVDPSSSVSIPTDRPASNPRLFRGEVCAVRIPPTGLALAGLLTARPLTILTTASEEDDFAARTASCLSSLLRAEGLRVHISNEVTANAQGLLFLDGLRPIANVQQGMEVNEAAFSAATQFSLTRKGEGVFITVQDTGGSFALAGGPGGQPFSGGLAGLVKVAGLEWPDVHTKAIDLEVAGRSPEVVAREIAAELLHGGPEQEVGINREGVRTTPWIRSDTLPEKTAWNLDRDAVMVVSGGARGVTAAALAAVVAQHPLRLLLLGRTALEPEPPCCTGFPDEPQITAALIQQAHTEGTPLLPIDARNTARQILAQREIAATLARFEALGVEVRYAAVDILDAAALGNVLEDVRRTWGPIRALVHGAGVLHDKLLGDKTLEQFRRVMHTKVLGLHHLLQATRQDPLSFLCLFSSIAARCGNVGQSDYAMANEILNKVAAAEQHRRGPDCVVKAIDWGPWDGGMVTREVKARFEQAGIPLISLEDGATAFLEEALHGSGNTVEVVILGKTADDACPDVRKAVPGAPAVYAADLRVSRARFPFLADHCIQGQPVLPLVIVLEFFARMARAIAPFPSVRRIRDMRVLSGLRLADFGAGSLLRIFGREGKNCSAGRSLEMELAGKDRTHYRATVELGSRRPASARAAAASCCRAEAYGGLQPDPYREVLFHGPAFRVLRSIETIAPDRARARLSTTTDQAWPGGPWLTDPAALDGGLQLARIWAHARCGFKSLPTSLGEFSLHQPEKPIAACELQARGTYPMEARFDLVFLDAEGSVVSELRDVSMTLEPEPVPLAAS